MEKIMVVEKKLKKYWYFYLYRKCCLGLKVRDLDAPAVFEVSVSCAPTDAWHSRISPIQRALRHYRLMLDHKCCISWVCSCVSCLRCPGWPTGSVSLSRELLPGYCTVGPLLPHDVHNHALDCFKVFGHVRWCAMAGRYLRSQLSLNGSQPSA
jgi:hypothetical protein